MNAKWIAAVAVAIVCASVAVLHQTFAQPAPKTGAPAPKLEATPKMQSMKDAPPRKIVVGSLMYAMYGQWPGLDKRLARLCEFIDQMAAEAKSKYNAGLDVVVLPEVAVNGGRRGPAKEISEPLEGPVLNAFAAVAKKHKTYVVVPMFMTEDAAKGIYYNVLALIDRAGKVAGIYRKVHPVEVPGSGKLEGGCLPGKSFPVFECDFGKLGALICIDIAWDDGWETLARKGAEIVVWSTQSPGIVKAQFRAMRHRYYVLSSTWRNNITLADPTGHVIAQSTKPSSVLVEQIDLNYMLIGWQRNLGNGKAFIDKYGKEAVGFRYSEAEDGGIFWSNDPKIPIQRMVRELKLELPEVMVERNRRLQDKLRGGPPSMD
ncbi:MAG TPA: carbon-nitrogen hydrolase family protein [Phycisphaerae bacterium]|nr:carbon-nitrogen hydrolase family protein [Phycisphaerae bacterium]HUT57363.1 carbon-nitrogen hydrolase family protein [Phycisphaerae bacterium]